MHECNAPMIFPCLGEWSGIEIHFECAQNCAGFHVWEREVDTNCVSLTQNVWELAALLVGGDKSRASVTAQRQCVVPLPPLSTQQWPVTALITVLTVTSSPGCRWACLWTLSHCGFTLELGRYFKILIYRNIHWHDMISIPSVQLSIYRYLAKLIKRTLTINATSVSSERVLLVILFRRKDLA